MVTLSVWTWHGRAERLCARCGHAIRRGEHYCLLPDRTLAHSECLLMAAGS